MGRKLAVAEMAENDEGYNVRWKCNKCGKKGISWICWEFSGPISVLTKVMTDHHQTNGKKCKGDSFAVCGVNSGCKGCKAH